MGGWLQNCDLLIQLIQCRCYGEFSVRPVFQSLDVTCGNELANEVAIANEVVIANLRWG